MCHSFCLKTLPVFLQQLTLSECLLSVELFHWVCVVNSFQHLNPTNNIMRKWSKLVKPNHQIQSHGCNLRSMLVSILLWDSRGHHVGIIDCINLEDVILAEATVKHLVVGVEEENHLNDESSIVHSVTR